MKIKLPPFIETFIVKFALSKSGPFIQKGISFLAAYIVAFLSQKVPGIEAHLDITVLTGILWAVIDNLIGLLPADIIKKYGREIQSAIVRTGEPIKIDGLVLSKTAEATEFLFRENSINKKTPQNTSATKVPPKSKVAPVNTIKKNTAIKKQKSHF